MIKKYDDFTAEYHEGGNKFEPLPAGAYVGKILGVKLENTQYGDSLVLQIDVTEGEHSGHYMKQYEESKNSQYGAKFKGILRINVPKNDGSEQDKKSKGIFGSNIGAIERSNQGYKWDWDETKLKGLAVGFVVREKEYYFEQKYGITTIICWLCPVQNVRDGAVKIPPMKEMNEQQKQQKAQDEAAKATGMTAVVLEEEELPF